MKNVLMALFACITATSIHSQGWVTGGTARIYAVNSNLEPAPINVGIGTKTPSAQLHTTGSVLFSGITNDNTFNRILVQNNSGSLFWRDASTLGAATGWALTGNAGTNPGTNFLGTTDNKRLVFKTNNAERMTILPTGQVGVGVATPKTLLHVAGTAGMMSFPYEAAAFEKSGDTKMSIYCSTPGPIISTMGGASVILGYSNATNSSGQYPGYEMQYGNKDATNFFLRFNAANRNAAGTVVSSVQNVMVMDHLGRVGINLGQTGLSPNLPTAKFHTKDAIRFENLPVGSGYALVVDASGNVFRAESTSARSMSGNSTQQTDINRKVEELEAEVRNLKMLLGQVLNKQGISMPDQKFIVYPNPSSSAISIKPSNENAIRESNKAIVRDVNGKTVAMLSTFNRTANIPLSAITNGTYFVTIYDTRDNPVQVEKVILSR